MVLISSNVLTMNPSQPHVEAIAVKGDRIVKVGSNKEIDRLIGENTKVLSLEELTVVPGLIDTHLHIADSSGVDGEGLQIGAGDIDFPALAEWLDNYSPDSSFIPEIWQGHENEGEGFWRALERLESTF